MAMEFTTRQETVGDARGRRIFIKKPVFVQRKKKRFVVFGTTIRKSEIESLKRKARRKFGQVKVIDATMKRRPGKFEPVQLFAVIARKIKRR